MWKDFWALSRTEQRGFFALAALLILMMLIVVGYSFATVSKIEYKWINLSVNGDTSSTHVDDIPGFIATAQANPNDLSIKELESLGFKPRAILNWKKYLEAGGTFKSTDDLLGIYGIDSSLVLNLSKYLVYNNNVASRAHKFEGQKYVSKVYIDINKVSRDEMLSLGWHQAIVDSIVAQRDRFYFTRNFEKLELANCRIDSALSMMASAASPHRSVSKDKKSEFVIEINSADTMELDLLKGIGPAYARRIVKYRTRIGGFYSLEQLLEVDGFSKDLLDKLRPNLKVNPSLIKPLNVNKESLRTLKEHPLIGFYKAKDIVELRKKIGQISSLGQVFELASFNDSDKQLMTFYLTTE